MKTTLFFLITILFFQCSTKKLVLSAPGDKLFEMSKSPCFGRCPVYTVIVYRDGNMKLIAKDNLEMKGSYSHLMDKTVFNTFKHDLEALKLKNFNDEYREAIADAPSTHIIYYDGSTEKKIFTNFQFPDSLQKITTKLDELVTEGEWTKIEDHRIDQEYIILLQPEGKLSDILKRYTEYDMTLGKRLDPATAQYWVVNAKTNQNEVDLLLKKLQMDKDIKSAQMNKALQVR